MPLWRGLGRGCTSPSSRHLVIRVFSLFCCHGKISLLSADLEGMLPALTALPPPLSNPITSAICEQHRGLCQASKSQVKLNKWEKRRKKRDLFSAFSVIPFIRARRLVMATSWLALFARRRSQPKVIATSSRGHGPSHSHFLLLSTISIQVSFC